MDAFAGLLIETGKAIFDRIDVNKNMGILEKETEKLYTRRRDVQDAMCGLKPKTEIDFWLDAVQKINDEVPEIKRRVEQMEWFHGIERFRLAKCVCKKIKEVVELKAAGEFSNGLFVDSMPPTSIQFPPAKLVGKKTGSIILKMREEYLKDDNMGIIGLYGMGGAGKTTIMTQIYNEIRNDNTFGRVIWVTFSEDSSLGLNLLKDDIILKLQDDVSTALGLNLLKDDIITRSAELFGAFKSIGKFFLILDNTWYAFPLEKIGIPKPNEANKCKIVLTTQSKAVCREMGSHKIIKVEVLAEDESWTLFQEKLGANISPEIMQIAKAVVEGCAGLPLAIITVGAAMRGVDDIRIWRTALDDLRNSRTEMILGMGNKVHTCLKSSFAKLKCPIFQDCFLSCALYLDDREIHWEQLTEHWMADGLLENEDRAKGFDEGYTIISYLKEACLLESGCREDHVKMHNLFRDLAISIVQNHPQFVVKSGYEVKQFLWDEKLMTGAVKMSLMSSNVENLPCPPKSCKKLSSMLLRLPGVVDIHHLFFERMPNLRVLDLSGKNILYLPESISNLRELCILRLSRCERLKDVPSLANLKGLMVLNLSGTSIKCLPKGLEGLTNLRCLDLTATHNLETFLARTILNLSSLKELCMLPSKWKWSSKRNGGGACVEDMLKLTHLIKLYVCFADLDAFNCYVRSGHWRDLKYFCLHIDNHVDDDYGQTCKEVKLHCINRCSNNMTLQSEIPSKDLSPTLNELVISKLTNLSSICKETEVGSLTSLKTICIFDCPKLEYVFSVGLLQALQNIETITVWSCGQEMWEMVVETDDRGESSNNNDNTITLPRLRTLDLSSLWKLKVISKRIFICNSLEEIRVNSCPNLKQLPLPIYNIPPSLKRITGSEEWWNSLDWGNPNTKSDMQRFFSSIDDDGINEINVAAAVKEEEKLGTKRKAITDAKEYLLLQLTPRKRRRSDSA